MTDAVEPTLLEEEMVKPLKDRTADELAERRHAISEEISALKRQDELLKAEREDINQEFIRRFQDQGITGMKAARFSISMTMDDKYPELFDRQAFEEYLLETGNLHLLQKRLSLASVQEELLAGNTIPGVRVIDKLTINQRKRGFIN